MVPVKVSGCVNAGLSRDEMANMPSAGMVIVNDIFFPLWENKTIRPKISLLFGSWGSGKTKDRVMCMLNLAMQPETFRGFYARLTFRELRSTVFLMFTDTIKKWGLENDFSYSTADHSTMVIRHIATGNMIIPFGASDPDSVKGITDPTHILLDEADRFNQVSFGNILSRLRVVGQGKTELWMCFNTHQIMPGHWIINNFFPEEEGSEADPKMIEIINKLGVEKRLCNYIDNYFCDHEETYNMLYLISGGDKEYFESISQGKFGVPRFGLLFPSSGLRKFRMEQLDAIPGYVENGPNFVAMVCDPNGRTGGGDDLACVIGKLIETTVYVTDVIYNNDPIEENKPRICQIAYENRPDWMGIEGVLSFRQTAVEIRTELENLGHEGEIRVLHPRTEKHARILADSTFIRLHCAFREDYPKTSDYSRFMKNLTSYYKIQNTENKNPTDDAPDSMSMISSYFKKQFPDLWPIQYQVKQDVPTIK